MRLVLHKAELQLDLKELRLGNCKALTMDVEINKFVEMTNLTTLSLSETNISALPKRIGDLTSLTELNLYQCESLVSLPRRFTKCDEGLIIRGYRF